MNLLDDPHLIHSIARRLAKTADRNQVIEEICLLHNLSWSQAEELVEHALTQHNDDITRQQTPILALLALAIFIGGAALAAWQLLGLVAVFSAFANPSAATFWEMYNLSFGFFDLLTNWWGLLGAFVTGLAMVLGSYLGMRDVWGAWLEALEAGVLFARPPAELSRLEPAAAVEAVFSAEGWIRNHPDDRETVEFIIGQMEKTRDRDWVTSSLALARGMSWQAADELVEEVLRAAGLLPIHQRVFPPQVVFSVLGIFIAGLVISLQYLLVLSVALRPALAKVTDQYWFIWFLYQAGEYIESAPGPFLLFALGLVMMIGGLLALRYMLPSVYRWGSRV